MADFRAKARDALFKTALRWAPKWWRDELNDRVDKDALRLNGLLLDSQGYVRCHVCPERFGGGMRRHALNGRKVYLCRVHHLAVQGGTLVLE